MYSKKTIEEANKFADGYEVYLSNKNWVGPEILFENMKKFTNSGDRLLDLGIGSGLASKNFKKLGLQIVGIDGSEEMLKVCKRNQIADRLICMDLAESNLELGIKEFQLVLSYAVFHMIFDLLPIFQGVNRCLVDKGYFGFSVIHYNSSLDKDFEESETSGVYSKLNVDSGIMNFRHTSAYINQLLLNSGFKELKQTNFIGFKDEKENREIEFSIYITQRIS